MLQSALNSRIVIEQAKGVLSGHRGITVDAAFDAQRAYASSSQQHLGPVPRCSWT